MFVNESDLDKASKLFERHGRKAVLIGHLIPGVTAFISTVAGLQRMPIRGRFLFYAIVGTALWDGILIVLGWVLGSQWTLVKEYVSVTGHAVLAAVALAILWFLWHRPKTHG